MLKNAVRVLFYSTVCCLMLFNTSHAQASSFTQTFDAECNGNDPNWYWNFYTGPFSSSANTYFMSGNASFNSGSLNLWITNNTYNYGNRQFTSAGCDTKYSDSRTYGKWEVRCRFPQGYGVQGYVGLFAKNGSWPPEVDFAEVVGRNPGQLVMTQHYNTNNTTAGTTVTGQDWTSSWHTYSLEWTPGKLRYLIDGNLKMTQNQNFSTTEMYLAIGTGCGDPGGWADSPNNSSWNGWNWPLPSNMQIDWVKIYQYNP